jgi:hypothetical protein
MINVNFVNVSSYHTQGFFCCCYLNNKYTYKLSEQALLQQFFSKRNFQFVHQLMNNNSNKKNIILMSEMERWKIHYINHQLTFFISHACFFVFLRIFSFNFFFSFCIAFKMTLGNLWDFVM